MNMNKENIQQLIDHLRKPSTAEHFDLNLYFYVHKNNLQRLDKAIHECGTVACIAGHATLLAKPDMTISKLKYNFYSTAKGWLGLDSYTARDLFVPENAGQGFRDKDINYDLVTAEIAAAVLENLLVTHKITWPPEVHYG